MEYGRFEPELEYNLQRSSNGAWMTACPICNLSVMGQTRIGTSARLFEHMNEKHHEEKFGHA